MPLWLPLTPPSITESIPRTMDGQATFLFPCLFAEGEILYNQVDRELSRRNREAWLRSECSPRYLHGNFWGCRLRRENRAEIGPLGLKTWSGSSTSSPSIAPYATATRISRTSASSSPSTPACAKGLSRSIASDFLTATMFRHRKTTDQRVGMKQPSFLGLDQTFKNLA